VKLSGHEARRFCAAPAPGCIGALLTGADAGLVAARRRELIAAIMRGEIDDLRLTRLEATEARRDPAIVDEALRARGFFPGRRVVLIENGTDGLASGLEKALPAITVEDAFLIVTAGMLTGRSALKRLFEGHKALACLALFADAPRPDDVVDALARKGLKTGLTRDAAHLLAGIGADIDHGSFEQLLEIIALHGIDAAEPLDETAVLALSPAGLDAEVDSFIAAVADGQPSRLAPLLRRLRAGGTSPVGLLLALQRHFRTLLLAAAQAGGPDAGIARIRPPPWGKRRDAFVRQLRKWSRNRLEQACRLLFEADSRVRSSGAAPDFALVERCALRLAIIARR